MSDLNVLRPPLEVDGALVTHLEGGAYLVDLAHDGARFTVTISRAAGGRWLDIVEAGSLYAYGPPRLGLDRLGRLVGPVYGLATPRYVLVAARALRALELDGVL